VASARLPTVAFISERKPIRKGGNGLDDPDQNFFENFLCGAPGNYPGNYNGYCNPKVEKLIPSKIASSRSALLAMTARC
jgi:ABC-type transport system substrate-binding protein